MSKSTAANSSTYQKGNLLYEGKAKRVYATASPDEYIVEYKDDATAFNGQKRGQISDKGVVNNRISNVLFRVLEQSGIPTHFIAELSDRETLVRAVRIIPLEVVVRNYTAGSLAKRLGVEEGLPLTQPIIEFYYKDDNLGDPLVNDDHILAFAWASPVELAKLRELALRTNDVLREFFRARNVLLVDFKLEFGRTADGSIALADEISPDTCRLWDATSLEKLDKDRFRRDLGQVEEAYQEMLRRVQKEVQS
jgi:phosphoribosylaminoimidazole-succinocarboxamide synthase